MRSAPSLSQEYFRSEALNKIVESLLKISKSTGLLIVVTLVTDIRTYTHYPQRSAAWRAAEACIHSPRSTFVQSRASIEDSDILFEPVLSWTAAGTHMAVTLGVPTLSHMPWATLCWTDVIFATIWGYTGIRIRKLTPDKQKTMLAELNKEKEA